MKGSKVHDYKANVPASDLWAIYGTLRASELMPELLPHVLAKVELVSGDGGVGTVLELTFPPGIPGFQRYKEKFVTVDNENYIKETEGVEGDILELEFLSYRIRFHVKSTGPSSSMVTTTIKYEIDEHGAFRCSRRQVCRVRQGEDEEGCCDRLETKQIQQSL